MVPRQRILKSLMAQMLERVAIPQIKQQAKDRAVALMVTINWYNMKCYIHNQVNMR